MIASGLIMLAAIVVGCMAALMLLIALAVSVRRGRDDRRREERLSLAFDRARDIRTHGSLPVGSRFGIFEHRVRGAPSMR